MQRIYRVTASGSIAVASGDVDLLLLRPAAEKPITLLGFKLSQVSDAQDAGEFIADLAIRHFTAAVTNGSGGSAPTPVRGYPVGDYDAAGFTARVLDTTVATTTGTNTLIEPFGWNIRNVPYTEWFTDRPDDIRVRARGAGEALLLRLEAAVASDISFRGVFYVAEEG